MDIYKIREERLRLLMTERFNNRQVQLAAAIDRKPDYISRILAGKKHLGEELAREIEKKLKLPERWLDQPVKGSPGVPGTAKDSAEYIVVAPYAGAGAKSMAHSPYAAGAPFPKAVLQDLGVSLDHGAVAEMPDESMGSTLRAGTLLLIDQSPGEPQDNELYAILYGKTLRIRRLLSDGASGHWILRSDNLDRVRFPDTISPFNNLTLVGRVVYACGRV